MAHWNITNHSSLAYGTKSKGGVNAINVETKDASLENLLRYVTGIITTVSPPPTTATKSKGNDEMLVFGTSLHRGHH